MFLAPSGVFLAMLLHFQILAIRPNFVSTLPTGMVTKNYEKKNFSLTFMLRKHKTQVLPMLWTPWWSLDVKLFFDWLFWEFFLTPYPNPICYHYLLWPLEGKIKRYHLWVRMNHVLCLNTFLSPRELIKHKARAEEVYVLVRFRGSVSTLHWYVYSITVWSRAARRRIRFSSLL